MVNPIQLIYPSPAFVMPRHGVDLIVIVPAVILAVQEAAGEIEQDRSPDSPPTYKQIKMTAMLLNEPFLKEFSSSFSS